MSFFTAYIEGWALYSEQLAGEMGMYDGDPLGQIGQLHDSMFRGVRLVVDTGMHAMKWSREAGGEVLRRHAGRQGSQRHHRESSAIACGRARLAATCWAS